MTPHIALMNKDNHQSRAKLISSSMFLLQLPYSLVLSQETSITSAKPLLRSPIAHDFSHAAAARADLIYNVSIFYYPLKVLHIETEAFWVAYLSLFFSIVASINASQSLHIPSKLVVACVGVDDGCAVVASCDFGCAFGVCLRVDYPESQHE